MFLLCKFFDYKYAIKLFCHLGKLRLAKLTAAPAYHIVPYTGDLTRVTEALLLSYYMQPSNLKEAVTRDSLLDRWRKANPHTHILTGRFDCIKKSYEVSSVENLGQTKWKQRPMMQSSSGVLIARNLSERG
jgi:hypothetical protein